MKKVLLTALLVLGLSISAWADPLDVGGFISSLNLKQGVAFSVVDSKLNYLSTAEVATLWEDKVSIELGYAGDADSTGHKIVGVASVNLLNLGDFIKFPLLKSVTFRPGIYLGAGSINTQRIMESELDYGFSLTLIDLKF